MTSAAATSSEKPPEAARTPGVVVPGRFAFYYCAAALLLFAFVSYSAVLTKCATTDEVVHAPAAYTHLRYFDYRVDPEHPPLWKYLAAVPWLFHPPADANVDSPYFAAVPRSASYYWPWGFNTLYHTPGNDADQLLDMSRAMMLIPAVALGALLAWWGYRVAGAVAAMVACTLFALDPNFMAHAPLVTNDVSLALATLVVACALWAVGRRITLVRFAAIAVCCAGALVTKFTAVMIVPSVILALAARALLPDPWPTSRGTLATRGRRLAAAAALAVACAAVTYAGVWAAYGFRFRTAPDPSVHPNYAQAVHGAVESEITLATGHVPDEDEIRNATPSLYVRSALFVLDHHLLPEPFAFGLLSAYARSLFCWSYVLGQHSGTGHWYYFPLAFVVKTPQTTLAVLLACALAAPWLLRNRWRPASGDAAAAPGSSGRLSVWLCASLCIPFAVFTYAAIRSNMNLGLRHVLQLYPFLYLAAGVIAARLYAARPKLLRVALPVLLLGLAAETLPAYPNYISFFNAASWGHRLYLLGDSNLDWGQDLPSLAEWQRQHPDRALFLAYTGTADPAYYKIRYSPLTLNTGDQVTRRVFPTTGVVAASATMLQTDWVRPEARAFFHGLRDRRPTEILGGSIYLYDLDDDDGR